MKHPRTCPPSNTSADAGQELGADHLINYKEKNFAEVVKERTTAKNLPVWFPCMKSLEALLWELLICE